MDIFENREFAFLIYLTLIAFILIVLDLSLRYEWFLQRLIFAFVILIIASIIKISTIYFDRKLSNTKEWED
ncbi:MAG: hypothetical protein ACUVTD_01055 [Nitrososphaerales archaeon]